MKNHESMYTDMRFQFSDSNLRCKKSASRVFLLGISEVFEKFHGDSSWGTLVTRWWVFQGTEGEEHPTEKGGGSSESRG